MPFTVEDGFGALMLGVYDQSKVRYAGHTGTGFSDEMLWDFLNG